ncbi:MAG: nuclear transport factor 2 family protein [Chitinophagaceae bacterium]|nr:nuclear transport factor 2 family protein [Chitinophagaceae bacterium]
MKVFFIVLVILFYSCNNKPDLAKEEKAIRDLLQQERKAHFDRNAELFVSEFADSMISINKGKLTQTSIEENKKRIASYFGRVQFIKWDDVAEPIIRFSGDGSLAYAIVQKQVILSYPDSLQHIITDTTDYAWVSIYRKQKGEWKVEANASTNK